MNIVGEDCTDIQLDADGQPVPDKTGDFATMSGDVCWKQDLMLEAHTDEGELFYEDEDGDDAYGFGLTDFVHAEYDAFTQTEIMQRVRGKLAKRTYLDMAKTVQELSFVDDVYMDRVSVSKKDSADVYNMKLTTGEVEVESE